MNIKTFRAKTMQQALNLVRQELGPEATVLHTRELNAGLVSRFLLGRQYEIAASSEVHASVRVASPAVTFESSTADERFESPTLEPSITPMNSSRYQKLVPSRNNSFNDLNSLATQLQQRSLSTPQRQLPEAMFQAYTDMIEMDLEENVAQQLVERLQDELAVELHDPFAVRAELARMISEELTVSGPLQVSTDQGRVVALVGPTGVGKTTTIAKLAANYRLRENKRVGLISVDTYRIAAVEQLRTYADIIDLPMEVVSTPREMREAVARMKELDLVLIDTAGRSPRDEVRIQELRSMLDEAEPDEVHLVLSAVGGVRSLCSTAERFATSGTTSMIVTKLDEATGLGNLLSLARNSSLPISYLTDGQNVPDDIRVADSQQLAQLILGIA
jgi:flagellar biosynthesis protein FlhF